MPSAAPAPTSTPLNEADQLPATNVTERPLAKDSEEVESDTVVESKRLKLSEVESEMDVDEFTEGTIDPDIANEINDLIGWQIFHFLEVQYFYFMIIAIFI